MDKNKLKALLQLLGKLAEKSIGITARDYRFNKFMDFEQSQGSGWLAVSEFVGTHNGCWCLDIHIFHDKDKEKISHLNNHNTVKIDVIPNTKVSFSSS